MSELNRVAYYRKSIICHYFYVEKINLLIDKWIMWASYYLIIGMITIFLDID